MFFGCFCCEAEVGAFRSALDWGQPVNTSRSDDRSNRKPPSVETSSMPPAFSSQGKELACPTFYVLDAVPPR